MKEIPGNVPIALTLGKERFYDLLTAHIILKSGPRWERAELDELPLGKLLDILIPNGIELGVGLEVVQR